MNNTNTFRRKFLCICSDSLTGTYTDKKKKLTMKLLWKLELKMEWKLIEEWRHQAVPYIPVYMLIFVVIGIHPWSTLSNGLIPPPQAHCKSTTHVFRDKLKSLALDRSTGSQALPYQIQQIKVTFLSGKSIYFIPGCGPLSLLLAELNPFPTMTIMNEILCRDF